MTQGFAAQSLRIAPPRGAIVQVRVSEAERRALVEQARRHGYETVSAYIRARTLGGDAPN